MKSNMDNGACSHRMNGTFSKTGLVSVIHHQGNNFIHSFIHPLSSFCRCPAISCHPILGRLIVPVGPMLCFGPVKCDDTVQSAKSQEKRKLS